MAGRPDAKPDGRTCWVAGVECEPPDKLARDSSYYVLRLQIHAWIPAVDHDQAKLPLISLQLAACSVHSVIKGIAVGQEGFLWIRVNRLHLAVNIAVGGLDAVVGRLLAGRAAFRDALERVAVRAKVLLEQVFGYVGFFTLSPSRQGMNPCPTPAQAEACGYDLGGWPSPFWRK